MDVRMCCGVVLWWCGDVVMWCCGDVVVWWWWCGGVVVWWCGGVGGCMSDDNRYDRAASRFTVMAW